MERCPAQESVPCCLAVRPAWHELRLRGRQLLAQGTTGVATVAGKLNRPFRIFTVLATVSRALANPTITRRMFTFPGLVMHCESLSSLTDSQPAFPAQ
jgi:hypothetical protein